MAEQSEPPGISIIEQMAAEHHERHGSILPWHLLSREDRLRLMAAMEAAVRIVPDRVLLKSGTAFAEVQLDQVRDALVGDHVASKRSVLSDQLPRTKPSKKEPKS